MREDREDESRGGGNSSRWEWLGVFTPSPGYALLVYCTTIMHCKSGSSHNSVGHDAVVLCWVTYTTSQMCPLDNGKGQTHTQRLTHPPTHARTRAHTHHLASHISNSPSDAPVTLYAVCPAEASVSRDWQDDRGTLLWVMPGLVASQLGTSNTTPGYPACQPRRPNQALMRETRRER